MNDSHHREFYNSIHSNFMKRILEKCLKVHSMLIYYTRDSVLRVIKHGTQSLTILQENFAFLESKQPRQQVRIFTGAGDQGQGPCCLFPALGKVFFLVGLLLCCSDLRRWLYSQNDFKSKSQVSVRSQIRAGVRGLQPFSLGTTM